MSKSFNPIFDQCAILAMQVFLEVRETRDLEDKYLPTDRELAERAYDVAEAMWTVREERFQALEEAIIHDAVQP